MAVRSRGVAVLLVVFTSYLTNTAVTHDTGLEYSVDGATDVEDVESVAVRLLERRRRDVDHDKATTTTTTTFPAPEQENDDYYYEDEYTQEEDTVEPVQGFNTKNTIVDHHRYYHSHTLKGMEEVQQYWVDFDSYERDQVVTKELLSASHRRAHTARLTFEFPFFGHLLRNITIATGGFLFTGDFVHTWLAGIQYIAPLMAYFDTSMSKNASVKYADNGTSFTVQWSNVPLKYYADAGTFTFQVTLHKNGDIVFTFKQIPVFIPNIYGGQYPVKIGLSDAYIVDRTILFVRRKIIYDSHKIDMKKKNMIGNWTAILFKALPTCVTMYTCTDCLSQKIAFQCQWCDAIGRCSDGIDRNRQEWLLNNCEARHTQLVEHCPRGDKTSPPAPLPDTFRHDASVESFTAEPAMASTQPPAEVSSGLRFPYTMQVVGVAVGVGMLMIVMVVVVMVVVVVVVAWRRNRSKTSFYGINVYGRGGKNFMYVQQNDKLEK